MVFSYLQSESISDQVINNRNSASFNDATRDAFIRDIDHPDNLNNRFNLVTGEQVLIVLQKGFQIFEKYNNQGALNSIEGLYNYSKDLKGLLSKENIKIISDFLVSMPGTQYTDKINSIIACKEGISVNSHQTQELLDGLELFVAIGSALKIDNSYTKTESFVLTGGPVQEMEQRIKDSASIIIGSNTQKIVTTGGNTTNVEGLGFHTEAEFLQDQLKIKGVQSPIILENEAMNTGDNARLVSGLLEGAASTTICTTDYGSLRVALTAESQMEFKGTKRIHGSDFAYTNGQGNTIQVWQDAGWWLSENGWRATNYAISRLVNYRSRTDPFI